MKTNFPIAVFLLLLVVSCSPKLTVQATEPAAMPTPTVAEPTAAAQPTVVSGASVAEIAHGKELYQNSCSNCHQLFSPASHSREEWAPILSRMQRKANLDDVDMASIRNYIHSQI